MFKKIIFTLILLILTIGVVTASENITSEDTILTDGYSNTVVVENTPPQVDDTSSTDDAKIVVTSTPSKYKPNNKFTVRVKDTSTNEYVNIDQLKYKFDTQSTKVIKESEENGYGPYYNIPCNLKPGSHKLTLTVSDNQYTIEPLTINFKIAKVTPTLLTYKTTTTKDYVTLKATVRSYGKNINEGKVKFKIKGKTYTVSVKNGVAKKNVKIKNGYHTYTAVFTSKNYNSDSDWDFAVKGNKYYTLKTEGLDGSTYSIKIPFKKYLKLIEAKRYGEYTKINVNTGKTAKFIKSIEIYKTKTVYKWKRIKVLDYEEFWDYGTSYSYDTFKYYKAGWTYVGGSSKTFSDGYEHYSIFKKKVKTTEKVYVGCKNVLSSKSYKLRFTAGVNENGKLSCRWDIPRENQLKANLILPHWNGKL